MGAGQAGAGVGAGQAGAGAGVIIQPALLCAEGYPEGQRVWGEMGGGGLVAHLVPLQGRQSPPGHPTQAGAYSLTRNHQATPPRQEPTA